MGVCVTEEEDYYSSMWRVRMFGLDVRDAFWC